MKILHIITSLGTGGAEKLIVETIPLYNSKGVEADVLVLHGADTPFYNQLKQLKCCNIYSLNLSYYNPISILKIVPFLSKYDLIHTHLFSAQYFTAIAKIFSLSKTPMVFTEHNTKNRRLNNQFWKLPERIIYSQYDKIICISVEIKHILENHIKFAETQLVVIENGINLEVQKNAFEIFKSHISQYLTPSDVLLVQVAGFRPQKDQSTLIKAFNYLPNNIKLILVGDGETRVSCESLVSSLNLSDRVIFLGVRNDIPSLLKTSDIVVLSSKYEGLSLSSIEAMASGKPFIASDVPGLREVVRGAGVLFPQGDEKALADEIMKLINNKQYYNEVAGKCVERAEKYDINIMVDKTIELYKSVLSEVK